MLFWSAWHALRYDRQYGAMGGETPIPFLAVHHYAERYEIEGLTFDRLLELVGVMDGEYLKWRAEQAPPPPNPDK